MKGLVKSLLPPSVLLLYAKIHLTIKNWKVLARHIFDGANSDITTQYRYLTITEKKRHCFFGYYDISPFNNDSSKILNITTDGKSNLARVNVFDVKSNVNSFIVNTHVWNWQQGCRLRWLPNSDNKIVFNDMENQHYCCKIVDIQNNTEHKIINEPLYDIDNSGKLGLSLNFARLGVKRPGYGYTILPYSEEDNPENEGVDIIDIDKNTKKRLFTFKDVTTYLPSHKDNYRCYYVNHLSFSPSGNKFLFFFLDSSTKRHEAFLFVYDLAGSIIIPLEIHDKVSHYVWKDDNEIIATVYDDSMNCGYYIYNIDEKTRIKYNNVMNDGHPSILKEGTIITDTYADEKFFQHLYIADKNGIKKEIAQIYDDPYIKGEERTDLHPRLSSNKSVICTDANIKGKRQMCVFYI